MALQGDPVFMIHSAVTLIAPHQDMVLYRRDVTSKTGIAPYVPKEPGKEDKEVCQFACEVPHKQITETQFRAAFKQMENACLEKARAAGLIR